MNKTGIEPGLLSLFRLSIGIWLLISIIGVLESIAGWNPSAVYGLISALYAAVLLWCLYARGFQHRMGRWYLPVAVLVATLGPMLAQWGEIARHMARELPLDNLKNIDLSLLFPLLIPAMIITVQYGYRAMLGFVVGATALQVLILYTFAPLDSAVVHHESPVMDLAGADAVARVITYPIVGLFVLRLVGGQKRERRALAAKNVQLTQYATTVERLAISHERNRLARDLHDTLAHTLSAVAVQVEALNKQLDRDPASAKKTLQHLRDLTRSGLQESRRALQALRASPLEDLGLALAMQQLVEATAERSGLSIALDMPAAPVELPPETEQGIYRITEEALSNAARHADAQNVTVSLRREEGEIRLTITDDGIGFDPAAIETNGHYGLVGMRERALLCNGQLDIYSAPTAGTTVRLTVGE